MFDEVRWGQDAIRDTQASLPPAPEGRVIRPDQTADHRGIASGADNPAAHGFNLSEVAELARVVRSTIYTVFGSREGLLRAVVQDMSERGGWQRMREAFRDPDAWQAVRRNIEEGTRMAASEHSVVLAITVLAAVDPDAAVVAAEMDDVRLRGLRSLAGRLGEQG